MLGSELGLQRAVPTTLEIDASAVTDGAAMERVSRQQRFQAARIAMLRSWVADHILRLLKTHTDDMRAEILPKPFNPLSSFRPKQPLRLCGRKHEGAA